MIRILLSLLFLEACLSKALQEVSGNYVTRVNFVDLPSFPDQTTVDDVTAENENYTIEYNSNIFSNLSTLQKVSGNYVTRVNFVDLPPFPDQTTVDDVTAENENYTIEYNSNVFSNLSSAYVLAYRICLDENKVQVSIRLSEAKIEGNYTVSSPTIPKAASQHYYLIMSDTLFYIYDVKYELENGKVQFGKIGNHSFLPKKVIGEYSNPPSELAKYLKNYLDPKLLEAVVTGIHADVAPKMNMDDVAFHVKNEMAISNRKQIADRLKVAIVESFDYVHQNLFNVWLDDKTNFNQSIEHYDATIPSFLLRDLEKSSVQKLETSFVDNKVHAKVEYIVPSSSTIFTVLYKDKNDSQAQNKIMKPEYSLLNLTYGVEYIANIDTNTVELKDTSYTVSGVIPSSNQGLYEDDRDALIHGLQSYIKSYFEENVHHPFQIYVKGMVADGRITHRVFDK